MSTHSTPVSTATPRDAGTPPRPYADGTIVRGPDETLYTFVGGELLEFEGLPKAADPSDLLALLGTIPPQLSADDLATVPRGAMPRGVIEFNSEEKEVESDMRRRYMQTYARLSQEAGRIDATTRIWTRQPFVGFTGGVMVMFEGANGECLGGTDLYQVAVDGFRIPFKQWKREVNWSQAIDPPISRATVGLQIAHTHAPKVRIQAIVNEAKQLAKAVAEVIATIESMR
jgi:hypothetical protein